MCHPLQLEKETIKKKGEGGGENKVDIIFNIRTFFVIPISGIECEFPASVSIYM